jgi:Arc/MetJ-type ribon-helix-helix transcriptional regulator
MAKVLVSLPDDLVERIDQAAHDEGATRSEFLAEAARLALAWPTASRFDELLIQARTALRDAGAFDSAQLLASDRAARDAADRRPR